MKRLVLQAYSVSRLKKPLKRRLGCFEVFIHNDMEAAMKVKSGQLDYYIGACNTGAGAALSIAIAVIGYNKVAPLPNRALKRKTNISPK